MKKLIKIAGGLVVVLVALFAALELSLDKLVLKGVNAAAPAALGVPVTLQDASISLLRGKAALQGLHIGNPEGFKTDGLFDLASISVDIDNSTLLSDTIVIREIAIDGLALTYEKGLLDSNLGALIEQLSAGAEKESPEAGEAEEPAEPQEATEKPAKKVVIEKLSITGSRMNFSITGAAALTGGGAIPLPLPPITLADLGKEKEGVTFVEAIQEVLRAIAGAAGTAIAGGGNLVDDAGKAVGEGAAEAGKAVGGAALDAGKAVGDALQNVNPFKK